MSFMGTMLHLSFVAVLVHCTATMLAHASAAPAGSRAGPKFMLLDDRNVFYGRITTATLALGVVEKHTGNPLIREDRDYEMRFDNMQPTIWYDPQLQKWRAWYSAFTNCSKPKSEIPMCNNARKSVCYGWLVPVPLCLLFCAIHY